MKVAIILGEAQGNNLKTRLRSIKDNLDVDSFDNVAGFLDSAIKRNAIYDRVVVLSTKLNPAIIQDLYRYWSDTCRETSVVMIGKKGADQDKALNFLETFKTPVAAAMLVSSTTVQLVAESVLVPATELTKRYGIGDFLKVELDDDSYKPEEPKPVEKPVAQSEQMPQEPREKRSLLGALFGGGKKKKTKQGAQPVQQVQAQPQAQPEPQVADPQADYYNNASAGYQPEPQVDQNTTNMGYQEEPDYYEEPEPTQDQNWGSSSELEYIENEQDFSISDNVSGDDFEPDDPDMSGYEGYTGVDSMEEPFDNTPNPFSDGGFSNDIGETNSQIQSPFTEKGQINQTSPSPVVVSEEDDDFSNGFQVVPEYENDFDPEVTTANESFEGFGARSTLQEQRDTGAVEVDASDDAMVLGSAEEHYRRENEQPRVITKTIVKEVPGAGGSLSVLNGVKSGRTHKILIVTGDRGSGITSTAFTIAQYLAKHVDVLYFDCDTDNHGILNYLDYSRFLNYENNHLNGVRLCRTSRAFDTCVIPWTDNLYILTSDFTCDTVDEDLKKTQEVVAERAADFGVVVVDCPLSKLPLMLDLSLTAQAIFCVEGSKRGFMNALCGLESSDMPVRHKRTLVSRGRIFVTKCGKNLDLKKLLQYFQSFFEPDAVDWLSMPTVPYNGQLNDKLLNEVLEG